jgi:hypothetical protein
MSANQHGSLELVVPDVLPNFVFSVMLQTIAAVGIDLARRCNVCRDPSDNLFSHLRFE